MRGKEVDGSDHNKYLIKFMQVTRYCTIKLNIDKLHFKTKQAAFFGTTFTSDGDKTVGDKVQAINKKPQPTSVTDLQCF